MLILLLVLSIALLVAYSQIALKWRMLGDEAEAADIQNVSSFVHMLKQLSASIKVSAYVTAPFAPFVWLYFITKLSLVVSFPVYINLTFVLVVIGGWFTLSESITAMRFSSGFQKLSGIITVVRN